MQIEQTCKVLRESIFEWVAANPDTVSRPFRLPASLLGDEMETKELRRVAKDTLHELGFEKRQLWVPSTAGKGGMAYMWVRHAD